MHSSHDNFYDILVHEDFLSHKVAKSFDPYQLNSGTSSLGSWRRTLRLNRLTIFCYIIFNNVYYFVANELTAQTMIN